MTTRMGTVWWIPAFSLSFLGGHFNVGFKIYPHEVGLALSLVALAWLVLTRTPRPIPHRPLDPSFPLLVLFMAAHAAVSCYLALMAETGGVGTIVRLYMNGLWGLVFAGLFWYFGDVRRFSLAAALATVFCLIRVVMGVLTPAPEFGDPVPTGFFVPPTEIDLRSSGLLLAALLVIWFYRARTHAGRMAIGLACVSTVYLAWLGASRVAALAAVVNLLIWAIVQRRRAGLIAGAAATVLIAGVVAALNYSPAFYAGLPDGARRALSAFVMTREVDEHVVTADSNEWHYILLEAGLRRWTRDAVSLTVGNPVEGWNPDYDALSVLETRTDVAARLATYENAIFTLAATLGLAGLLLFVRALYWLYRPFTIAILRRGIRAPGDALTFVAVQSLLVYVAFSWISGGYPSTQLMFGVLAAVAFRDRAAASAAPGHAS